MTGKTKIGPPSSGNTALDGTTVTLAAAMAPMLLAVAIFSLTLLRETKNPSQTITDEVFAFLSGICLLGSATSADAAMDNCEATTRQRLTFLRLGYLLFCAAICTLTTAIPILYAETEGMPLSWPWYVLFLLTGISVGAKPMVYKEPKHEYSLTAVMVGFYAVTIVSLFLRMHSAPHTKWGDPRPFF